MIISSYNIENKNINNSNFNILDELENIKSYIDCFELSIKEDYTQDLNKEDLLSSKLNKTINKLHNARKGIKLLKTENTKLNLKLNLIKEIQNLIISLPYISTKYKNQLSLLLNKIDTFTISQLENQIQKIKSLNQ